MQNFKIMIVEFSVANFKSFKDLESIQFQAAKIKSKYEFVDANNTFDASDKIKLLKSKAVYGANASGKTNLVKAFKTMLSIITESFKDDKIIEEYIEPFRLSEETIDEPTFFEIIFIYENVKYRYGMTVKAGKVIEEWLFGKPGKREVYYFVREDMTVQVNENKFKEVSKIADVPDDEIPMYSDTSLFLTVAAASQRKLAKSLLNYLKNQIEIISGLDDTHLMDVVMDKLEDETFKNQLTEFISSVDTGIKSIRKVDLSDYMLSENVSSLNGKRNTAFIQIERKVYDTENNTNGKSTFFMLDKHEAEGTKKMIALFPFIQSALKQGKLLIIDEFDARMHPRLVRTTLELFNSRTVNPNNAQLFIVSHATHLMRARYLRRDQISLIEKSKFGVSRIYSLAQFKENRNDVFFENDYLTGAYGSVPFTNQLSWAFSDIKMLENA